MRFLAIILNIGPQTDLTLHIFFFLLLLLLPLLLLHHLFLLFLLLLISSLHPLAGPRKFLLVSIKNYDV